MEKLTVQPVPWSDDVRESLRPAFDHDTTGGLLGMADLEQMGRAFEVDRGGVPVAHYVLSFRQWAGGAEGYILAAAGAEPGRGHLGGDELRREVLPMIEQQFLDVRAITVHTKRLGLARELGRAGYVVDGYILRKHVTRGTA